METVVKRMLKQISDITECPICAETFTDPKVLPCVHTFCLKCLITYGKHENNDKPGDQVCCPLCRIKFLIPPGGFTDLPNNFFVNKLVLVNQLSGATEAVQTHKCDVCIEDPVDAAGYCIECDQHFCEKCCKGHKIVRSLKSHHVVSLNERPGSETLLKMTASYCVQHPDEQIKLYCFDCKMVTCVLCHVTDHQKHVCSDIKKSADEFRKPLDDDIKKVTICAQQSRDKLQQLERDNEGFLKKLVGTEESISAEYDKLKSLLDSNLSQLMEEINTIKAKRVKEVESKRGELERQCMIVESFKRYCEEMKEKGTACDISRAANDLHTRSAELVKAQEEHNRQQLDRVELTFTSSPVFRASSTNLIGTINFNDSSAPVRKDECSVDWSSLGGDCQTLVMEAEMESMMMPLIMNECCRSDSREIKNEPRAVSPVLVYQPLFSSDAGDQSTSPTAIDDEHRTDICPPLRWDERIFGKPVMRLDRSSVTQPIECEPRVISHESAPTFGSIIAFETLIDAQGMEKCQPGSPVMKEKCQPSSPVIKEKKCRPRSAVIDDEHLEATLVKWDELRTGKSSPAMRNERRFDSIERKPISDERMRRSGSVVTDCQPSTGSPAMEAQRRDSSWMEKWFGSPEMKNQHGTGTPAMWENPRTSKTLSRVRKKLGCEQKVKKTSDADGQ